jgi:hypothetical protein
MENSTNQVPVGMNTERPDLEWSAEGHETLSDQEQFEYQQEIKKKMVFAVPSITAQKSLDTAGCAIFK